MHLRETLSRLALTVLLAALLLAQTLGQLHRVAHPAGSGAGQAHAVAAASENTFATGASVLMAGLFQHQQQDGDCRLYDQMCVGDGAAAAMVVTLSMPLPLQVLRLMAGAELARRAALFEARGPPVSL